MSERFLLPLSDDDRREVAEVLPEFEAFLKASATFIGECFSSPLSGSTLDSEAWTDPTSYAFGYGATQLGGAIDHHNAALSFFRTGVLPQYSCYTLVRGGLEASARAWWLLDHHVTTEGRLRRGFAERIYNLGRILELEAQHRTDRAAKRLTGVQADARHRGVVPEPRPGITRLLSMLLPSREREDGEEAGRYVYRILSGYAHGEAWVMHTGSTPVPDTANGDAVGLMSTLNINVILSLMRAALRGHDVAMQALCALAGRPANAWEERRSPLYPDGHSMATDT